MQFKSSELESAFNNILDTFSGGNNTAFVKFLFLIRELDYWKNNLEATLDLNKIDSITYDEESRYQEYKAMIKSCRCHENYICSNCIVASEPQYSQPSKNLAFKCQIQYKASKCTCGSEKCGSNLHSNWCDKYEL